MLTGIVAFVVGLAGFAPPAAAADGPNVIVILADDLGAHDLGSYGSTFYETPNLDKLAAAGARFTRAYAACPVCSPTRSALMTGKYPPRTGVTNFIGGAKAGKLLPADYQRQLALDEVTLAEALREGGYVTGMAGKWHLGGPEFGPDRQGFVESANADRLGWNQRVDRSDPLTEFALRFLESHRDQRFFLYLPHNLVHVPLLARAELLEKYRKKAEALPKHADAERFRPEHANLDRRIQDHVVYATMMEDLDTSVGRVMAKLDALKIADRTIVIFTSDNGGLSTAEGSPTSNQPLRAGKGWLYEGGVRVPLIVRWPGRARPGTQIDTRVITTDIYPTLLAAAGLAPRPDQHLDGVNLLPLLEGGNLAARPLFWHYPHYSNQGGGPAGSVIDGGFKLIETFENGKLELFDLARDPGERNDLAASEPARVRALHERLTTWRKDVGARPPTPNPNHDPNAPEPTPKKAAARKKAARPE